jgi:hypothetical protein
MLNRPKTRRNLIKLCAVTLAFVTVVFFVQVLSHSHAKGQNEGTCQVCQGAHIGSAPATATLAVHTPLLPTGYVPPFVLTFHQELFGHDSPSRAPPTA